jgi:hypothetical protein
MVVNNILERMWKEADMASFTIFPFEGTEENHEILQPR